MKDDLFVNYQESFKSFPEQIKSLWPAEFKAVLQEFHNIFGEEHYFTECYGQRSDTWGSIGVTKSGKPFICTGYKNITRTESIEGSLTGKEYGNSPVTGSSQVLYLEDLK